MILITATYLCLPKKHMPILFHVSEHSDKSIIAFVYLDNASSYPKFLC